MIKVKKANVIYSIDEKEWDSYKKEGFNKIDKNGKEVKENTSDKDAKKLQQKIEALEEELTSTKNQLAAAEETIGTLKAEKETLNTKVIDLEEEVKSLKATTVK